ncbi:aconitase X catalytic domain-containing protein [Amycolatopsis sp.]|uniref:aconitase X catalytic domain-containing protein n=1 Tax=Amycolatopsis sp. TaxID=37632 RepID=UPI002B6C4E7C|nr:aconitase X catalytic domain-containing protein [Amycolatopsis sp.]HVV08017.1 aconitase X catalytic domain-containing protein [Amycolatopsis sp.]
MADLALSPADERMLAGDEGPAVKAALELLVRYGGLMGAERLIDTDNVCGANIFGPRHARVLGTTDPAALFSRFSLDLDEKVDLPPFRAHSCQLIGPRDSAHWDLQGVAPTDAAAMDDSEAYLAEKGVDLLSTCTPYQVGNVPRFGEHCAWMESSAVVYINSVLGARTNTEGRESSAASMLTGRTPFCGYHLDEHRRATHLIEVRHPVVTTEDWNIFGYWTGDQVQDAVPVLTGPGLDPAPVQLKQFGAAAASSGDVEMYHLPGVTPEARTVEQALGGRAPAATSVFDAAARAETVASLCRTAKDREVDFVMIGCPHASLAQVREVARLLDGKRVAGSTALWVFTPRALRTVAERSGYVATIEKAGGRVLSDTCPAIGQFLPPRTRVFATDSAKQAHYLPAITGVQGWFGSVEACVAAALSGRWSDA